VAFCEEKEGRRRRMRRRRRRRLALLFQVRRSLVQIYTSSLDSNFIPIFSAPTPH